MPNHGDTLGTTNDGSPLPNIGTDAAAGTDQTRGTASPERLVEPLPPAIEDFDAIVNGDVQTFVNMSEDIGGLVAEQVELILFMLAEVQPWLTSLQSVCCPIKSFHRAAQIPSCHYQSEETRHPVTGVHGGVKGAPVYHGLRQ